MRAEAHAIACGVRIALQWLSLPRTLELLERLPRTSRAVTSPAACDFAAAEAARRVAHPTCLYTALTAFALLVRRGYAARLVIGAAPGGDFAAHAWVTIEGRPLTSAARPYVSLWSYGPPNAGAR